MLLPYGFAQLDGKNEDAARAHARAARTHLREAAGAYEDGDQQAWDNHMKAAQLHDAAAKQHWSCCGDDEDPETVNARKRVMEDEDDDDTDDECDDDDDEENCNNLNTNRKGRHMYRDFNADMECPKLTFNAERHSFDNGECDAGLDSAGDQREPQYGKQKMQQVKKTGSTSRATPRTDYGRGGSGLVGEPNAEDFDGRGVASIEEDDDWMDQEQLRRLGLADIEGHPEPLQGTIPAATKKLGYATALTLGNAAERTPEYSSPYWMEPLGPVATIAAERRRQLLGNNQASNDLVVNSVLGSSRDGDMEPDCMSQVINMRRAELGDKAITQRTYGRTR
jgi:hypothetical protein